MCLRVGICVFCVFVRERDERERRGRGGRKAHVDSLINHETDSAVS